jgi:hypothetical protein
MSIQIGTIVEGWADYRVICNILQAFDIDINNSVTAIRPNLQKDNTDLRGQQSPNEFGSWTNVRNECLQRENIYNFFNNQIAADAVFLIVQIDADTSADYGVAQNTLPQTAEDFSDLRQKIIDKINDWLAAFCPSDNKYLYAIAIRNTDAWVLSLHQDKHNKKDTGLIISPKDKVEASPEYKKAKVALVRATYDNLTQNFRKKKLLKAAIAHNQSLKDFVFSLEQIFGAL